MALKAYRLNRHEAWAGKDLADAVKAAVRASGRTVGETYDDRFAEELPGDMEVVGYVGGLVKVEHILASMERFMRPGLVCYFEL